MFNKIISFFKGIGQEPVKYTLGSLESVIDTRNIQVSSFQQPEKIPVSYETPMPKIANQGSKPRCVGEGGSLLLELFTLDDRSACDCYAQCKKLDGIETYPGTYPNVMAKVVHDSGIALTSDVSDDWTLPDTITLAVKNVARRKSAGYAFVTNSFEAVCQAVYKNKGVGFSVIVDDSWYMGAPKKYTGKGYGRHYMVIYGYDQITEEVLIQNSWGEQWGNGGRIRVKWDIIKDTVMDMIVFTGVPAELLDNAKKKTYRFTQTLMKGTKGVQVKELQKYLGVTPVDGDFGKITEKAVIGWQTTKGLPANGIIDADDLKELNKTAQSYLKIFAETIKSHEGFYKGSRSWRNNNPANFKPGSLTPYMAKLGAIGVDDGGFAKFPTLAIGEKALETFLTDTFKGFGRYKKGLTIYQYMQIYAPEFENDTNRYAEVLAKACGVSVNTKVEDLL